MVGARLVALGILAAVALVVFPRPVTAQSKPRAERPTYAVGERWVLGDGTYTLTRIDKDLYVFVAGPGREIHLSRDLALARIQRGAEVVEFSPPPKITWPLEVGRWGRAYTVLRTPEFPRGVSATDTWKVDAYDDVDLPGGRVKAFRIVHTIVPEPDDTGSRALRDLVGRPRYLVMSYAPELRQLVVSESPDLPLVGFRAVPERPALASEPRTETTSARPEAPAARPGATDTPAESRPATPSPPPSRPAAPPAPGRVPPPPADVAGAGSLQLTVSSPADQARVQQETIALAGLAWSPRGVSQVTVMLNGVEVRRLQERSASRSVTVSAPVTLREGLNTLVVTATDADGASRQEVRTVHFDRPTPLTVDVRLPEDRARVTEASAQVVAVATSSRGIARVAVSVNGVEVFQRAEPDPQRSVAVNAPVTLRDGANTVVVTARDGAGTVRQEVRTVVLDRTAAPTPASPGHARWAVVIGIGRYDHAAIPRLRYAVADAEAMYQTLLVAGFPRDHMLLLTDTTERKPTLRNIKYALGTFLARSARKDDTVVIFFAGHGAPEVDQRGVEADGLAKYLIPSDADADDLYSTAMPMDELQTIFGRIEAERVVAFLDACYSGAAGGRTFSSRKTRATKLDDVFLERLTRSRGRAIVTASRPSEVSIELPELGHGIFTHYLVQGLRGDADLNRDGIVSLQELYEFLEQQVSAKSRAVGGNQHPVMKGELEGVLPLTKVGRGGSGAPVPR